MPKVSNNRKCQKSYIDVTEFIHYMNDKPAFDFYLFIFHIVKFCWQNLSSLTLKCLTKGHFSFKLWLMYICN